MVNLTKKDLEQVLDKHLAPLVTKQMLDKRLASLATKKDLVSLATKKDLTLLATKKDLLAFATKQDLAHQTEVLNLKIDEKIDELAAMTQRGFAELDKKLDVRKEVEDLQRQMKQVRDAIGL